MGGIETEVDTSFHGCSGDAGTRKIETVNDLFDISLLPQRYCAVSEVSSDINPK